MAKLLIVDDSRTSRKMLAQIIEDIGHTVVGEAADGEQAFLKYKELKPDLVTLDITMPKMDGLEALRLIIEENKDARVIMVSAAGQKDRMIKAIKCGARDFINKPLDSDEIQMAITEALMDL